jgi:pilus assembly protein TadC
MFETDQFGLSERGLHLLRGRYNYDTIGFDSIDSIKIVKGRQVNNWFVLLLIGLILFSFGLFATYKVIYEYFFADNFIHFYIEQFLLPILPLFLGAFSIYFSLTKGPVLKISVNNKTKQFPIGQLEKNGQIDDLHSFFCKNPLIQKKFEFIKQ